MSKGAFWNQVILGGHSRGEYSENGSPEPIRSCVGTATAADAKCEAP